MVRADLLHGVQSGACTLLNSVYQGTVWGPWLWNCMFEDARRAVTAEGYTEKVFADDLNCYKAFSAASENSIILTDLRDCQASLHKWGETNSTIFDASKESLHILHRKNPYGESFKLTKYAFI